MDAQELERIGWRKIAFGYIPLCIGGFLIFLEVYSALSSLSNPIPQYISAFFVLVGWLTLRYA